MTIEYIDADSEIFARLKTDWDANTAAIVGYVPELRYQGAEVGTIPTAAKHWARASIQTVTETQATLHEGAAGNKRFNVAGLIFVQLFSPKAENDGWDKCRKLAKVARNAFRGKKTSGGIWFRNCRINDNVKNETNAYRINVVCEFEFDEIG